MKRPARFPGIPLLMIALVSCEQQDPWHDSDQWNPEMTARHLAVLLEAQVELLEEAVEPGGLPEKLQQELWALMIDECDTGYEVFVRINRNGLIKQDACDALSLNVGDVQARKEALLQQLKSNGQASILKSTAPSSEAWEVLEPRIAGYSVQALQIRCDHPEGYWDWSIPSD